MRDILMPLTELAGRTASAYARLHLRLAHSFMRGVFFVPRRERTAPSASRRDQRSEIVHLLRLFRSALGPDESKALIQVLNTFSRNSERVQRAVIVWLDLLEVLIQDAEARYGGRAGTGKLKKADVKNAFRYLARTGKFALPSIPPALQPLIFDIIIDLAVDEIVLITNRYDLWEAPPERAAPGQRFADFIRKAMMAIGSALARIAGRVVQWFGDFLAPALVLSPKLEAALKTVEAHGLIANQEGLATGLVRLVIQLGTHRREIINATELIFAAVQQAETFISLSGPGKKEYARDVIWAVLEDAGLLPRPGLMTAIIDSFIDLLIETSVHLFHKRGAFRRSDSTHGIMSTDAA